MNAQRSLFRQIVDAIFGFDFFISYRWSDGREYAAKLAQGLEDQGFECFLDSTDYEKGDNWRLAGRIALRNTTRLLVVCSPEVLDSGPVADEVETFLSTKRGIIPIDIGATLENAPKDNLLRRLISTEVISIGENPVALRDGPSRQVLEDLRSSFNLTRQSQKRQRLLGAAALSFAVLAIVALVSFWKAETRRLEALSRALAAQATVESERQLDLALLLAAKADQIHSTTSSHASLLTALGRTPLSYYLYAGTPVGVIAISPVDPDLLAGAGWDHSLSLWNLATRSKTASATVVDERIETLAFSPDGKFLVTDGEVNEVLLWRLTPRLEIERVISLDASRGDVKQVVFLDSNRILAASDGGTLTVLNLDDVIHHELQQVHAATPSVLFVSKTGDVLVTAGSDNQIALWDVGTDDINLRGKPFSVNDQILAVDFDQSRRKLLAGLHDNGVILLDTETGEFDPIPQSRTGGRVFDVAFVTQQGDDRIAVWGGDDEISVLRISDGLTDIQQWPIHRDAVLDLIWEPGRARLITAGRDGKIAVLDLKRQAALSKHLATFDSHTGWITAALRQAREPFDVFGDRKGKLYLMDYETGSVSEGVGAHDGKVVDLVYSKKVNQVISLGADNVVRWWSIQGSKLHRAKKAVRSTRALTRLAVAPKIGAILGLGNDGTVFRVSSGETPEVVGRIDISVRAERGRPIFEAHPTEPWVIAGASCTDADSCFARIGRLDWERGAKRWQLDLQSLPTDVAINAVGEQIVLAVGTSIELRDAESGGLEAELHVGRLPIDQIRLSEKTGLLAAIDSVNTLTFWNLEERVQIGPAHDLKSQDTRQSTFVDSGSTFLTLETNFVSGIYRYQLQRWDTDPTSWQHLARSMANRRLSEAELDRFGLARTLEGLIFTGLYDLEDRIPLGS